MKRDVVRRAAALLVRAMPAAFCLDWPSALMAAITGHAAIAATTCLSVWPEASWPVTSYTR